MCIESGGHTVVTASDGISALEMAKGSDIDLALLDVGLSIARRIMQAHGGDIELLTDDVRWRTKFVMRLPLED